MMPLPCAPVAKELTKKKFVVGLSTLLTVILYTAAAYTLFLHLVLRNGEGCYFSLFFCVCKGFPLV